MSVMSVVSMRRRPVAPQAARSLDAVPAAALSGVLYIVSVALPLGPTVSLLVIVAGRLLMGVGEALFITGSLA